MLYQGMYRGGGRYCVNSPGTNSFYGENFNNGSSVSDAVSSIEVFAYSDCPLPIPGDITFNPPAMIYTQSGKIAHPQLVAHVSGGVLDPLRGDRLVWVGGEIMGAAAEHVVKNLVNEGESYVFDSNEHPGFSFIAPGTEGVYQSFWQIQVLQAFTGQRVDLQVIVDNTPPMVNLIDPGEFLTNEVFTIQVSAEDLLSGVDQVQFFAGYQDGIQWAWHTLGWDADGSDGFSLTWNAASVLDQPGVALYAYAWDKAGNGAGSVVWDRTLDRLPPNTMLGPLPANSGSTALLMNFQGSDTGSGLAVIDIQVQFDGGGWTDWVIALPLHGKLPYFIGEFGHQYAFRMRGIDRAGLVEEYPASAEAETTIQACQSDAFEPDGSIYKAIEQQSQGGFTRHTLCGIGDEDWVRFWASSGSVYVFESANLGLTTDTVIELYNNLGELLASNDNFSPWGVVASRLVWFSGQDDWFYLRIRHVDSRIAGDAVFYDLRIRTGTWSWLPVFTATHSP